jgi:hypothetical protein
LENNVLIENADQSGFSFLGPMGDVDPTDFINQETNRIPFKTSPMLLLDWNLFFPLLSMSSISLNKIYIISPQSF